MPKYLLILIILATGKLYGQDPVNDDTCKNYRMSYRIERINNRKKIIYEMGGKPISYEQFVERLNLFSESADEFKLAKKSQKTAMIIMVVSMPVFIAGVIFASKKKVSAPVIIGGSAVAAYPLRFPMLKSVEHQEMSLIIYNLKICGSPYHQMASIH